MKSLRNGTSSRFRIAAAIVFSVGLLLSSPSMAVESVTNSYNFGEVESGTSATATLEISSLVTSASIELELLLTSQVESSVTESCFSLPNSEISVLGAAQFQVTFSPSVAGSYSDTLQVRYGGTTIYNLALQGTGIEAVAAAPADLSPMAAAMQRWAAAVAAKEYKGQTIGDRVQQCIESADNHGEAVSCVADFAKKLQKERMISRRDAKEMREYAAKSRYHQNLKKQWIQKKAEVRESREKQGRRWSNWD